MTAVAFDRVSKSYGDVVAAREVSFEVPEGEVFGLLGPNGAGKTTLLRALMDIVAPDAGELRLFGEPLDRRLLDRVGYLPEESGLYQKQRVLEVMTYFGRLKGLPASAARRSAAGWLDRMGLGETRRYRVERLSKGMRQKVQIASSLIADPPLAVLDEPFSGLDPVNVQLVRELIGERRRRGQTTILSTHQMGLVESLCDRVALIHGARLLVYDELAALRRRWSRPEVTVGAPSAPPAVRGVLAVDALAPGRFRLRLAPDAAPADVLRALVEAGAAIGEFQPALASMEEIFVQVVASAEAGA